MDRYFPVRQQSAMRFSSVDGFTNRSPPTSGVFDGGAWFDSASPLRNMGEVVLPGILNTVYLCWVIVTSCQF